ncbi:GPI transamidase component PIG-T-like, partial [Homarus americanus]
NSHLKLASDVRSWRPDTGGQTTVADPFLLSLLGLQLSDQLLVSQTICTVESSWMSLMGRVFINITGTVKGGHDRSTKQLCYIAKDYPGLFLSRQASFRRTFRRLESFHRSPGKWESGSQHKTNGQYGYNASVQGEHNRLQYRVHSHSSQSMKTSTSSSNGYWIGRLSRVLWTSASLISSQAPLPLETQVPPGSQPALVQPPPPTIPVTTPLQQMDPQAGDYKSPPLMPVQPPPDLESPQSRSQTMSGTMCHFHFLLVIICGPWLMVQGRDDNTFTEELLIRPLSTGHVYSHFEFTTTWATPGIKLHLSLTQGLWRHRKWGYPIVDAPPGAQLWVWFNPTTNKYSGNSSYMRYAALPRENVCTENLTPWKKLLPCDTRSGLSMLLYPVPLYTAHYHALSLHLRPSCQDVSCTSSHLELTQALSLVQGPTISSSGHQDWSLQQLFSSQLIYTCPLASFSRIYVDVTGNVDMKKFTLNPEPDIIEESGSGVSVRQLAVYDIQAALAGDGFNIEATYKSRHIYGILPPPNLHVSRFITVYVSKLVTARDREQGWLYEAVVEIPASSTIELSLEFTRALLKWLEYPPDANHGFYIPAATISAILPNSRNVSVNNLNGSTLKEKLLVQDRASFVRIHTETLLVSLPTPDFSMPYNVICLACTVVALAFGPIHNITTKKLVLKKIEPKESFFSRIMNRIKSIVKRGHKTGNDSIANNSTQEPVTVEENPLYEDREELEDIAEEEEDEDKLSCKSMNDYENKKNR